VKWLFAICFFILTVFAANGQSGTWVWVHGDNTQIIAGIYGNKGIPSVNNYPPGLYHSSQWTDNQGKRYLLNKASSFQREISGGRRKFLMNIWLLNKSLNGCYVKYRKNLMLLIYRKNKIKW
jgi:hypothetical protein